VTWYSETLGLTVFVREDQDKFCLLGFPEGEGKLALVGEHPVELGPVNRCMPNIHCQDLRGTVAALKKKGVKFLENLHGEDEGYRLITALDPEGNYLQLYEYA
jgi:predicted enzyme related to lactoylglutathione lyase